jgi:hypothetical protein
VHAHEHADRHRPAEPHVLLVDAVEVAAALHEDAGAVAPRDHQAVVAEVRSPRLRIARDHDGARDVRAVGVPLVVDEPGQEPEVDVRAAQHVLVHGAVRLHRRRRRALGALAVARAHHLERAVEGQRQPPHRPAHVGHQREARALDVLEQQDRRALPLLQLGDDGRRLVARVDLALDLDEVGAALGAHAIEEAPQVEGDDRHGRSWR